MKRSILLLLLTAYGCFGQKTVEQLETEMLNELADVHKKIKSVQDENRKLIQGKGTVIDKAVRSYRYQVILRFSRERSSLAGARSCATVLLSLLSWDLLYE